jgi:hypothetical protein
MQMEIDWLATLHNWQTVSCLAEMIQQPVLSKPTLAMDISMICLEITMFVA